MSLQIITPPSSEPVTLADVKLRLRLTTTADDTLISQYITIARVFVEKITRKSLVTKTYSLTLPRFPWPQENIKLPMPPVASVSFIKYLDPTNTQQTWDSSEYIVGLAQLPAVILPAIGYTYPETFRADGLDAVTIQFVAGPGTGALAVPMDTELEGVRKIAQHFYEHPEAITAENLKEMPLGIQALFGKVYYF